MKQKKEPYYKLEITSNGIKEDMKDIDLHVVIGVISVRIEKMKQFIIMNEAKQEKKGGVRV